MKKFFLFLFFSLFIFSFPVRAEEIKKFTSNVVVNKNGIVNIEETIVYDFGGLQRHGIFRNIPFIKTNADGKKYQLELTNFSVVGENNLPYQFTQSKVDKNLQLKIGDPDKTISGVHTYIIRYQAAGAITYFSEHDELYWNITGNDWLVPISSVEAKIILPEGISQELIKGICFTGSYGSTRSDCQISQQLNEITFTTINRLQPKEGLTAVVKFPINVVAHLEPKPFVSFWDTPFGKLASLVIGLLVIFWYIFLPIYIIYRWFKYGRDPKVIDVGEVRAWYDPPKTPDGKRFLTPAEVGVLGDETVDLKDISATIVDLARRGCLRIEERKKGDFYLIKDNQNQSDDYLIVFEKLLLEKFFGNKNEIRLKNKQLYNEVEEVKKSLYEQVVNNGLFPKNPQSIRNRYYILAFIALFTGNLFLSIVAFIFGRSMPRKTIEGVKAKNIAFSLRNFLKSQERQLTFQADKQMMFERLLPYAIVFGVEKIWAKRFENLGIKQPDWYQGYSVTYFNSSSFVNSLNSSMSSFRSAATPTRSSSGFSSGFSSGGGFSGGGGGGGGGGSW